MSDVPVENTTKTVDKKEATFFAMIVSALWIAGWSAVKFLTDPIGMDIKDVMLSGFAIAGCFSPVYINLIIKNLKDLKSLKG